MMCTHTHVYMYIHLNFTGATAFLTFSTWGYSVDAKIIMKSVTLVDRLILAIGKSGADIQYLASIVSYSNCMGTRVTIFNCNCMCVNILESASVTKGIDKFA